MHGLASQGGQQPVQDSSLVGTSWPSPSTEATGASSLFELGKDPEIKGSSQFAGLLSFASDPSLDHLAPKDQDSFAQPPSLQQLPGSMDTVLLDTTTCQVSTQGTVWVQQEPLQPTFVLPQGANMVQQQSLDPSLWVMPTQGLQQQQVTFDATSAQLQALQGSGTVMDMTGMPVLQGNSMVSLQPQQHQGGNLMPLQQGGINATINGVPVVLQVQNSPAAGQCLQQLPASSLGATLQPMAQTQQQQVYVAPVAQQTLVVGNTAQQMSLQQAQISLQQVQQQQQQILTNSIPAASAGTDPALHQQLQQLQEAVQQLSSQTAAVQRVLATHVSQPQASQAQPAVLEVEGSMRPSGCPTLSMPAQMPTSTANSSSPAGSTGHDSLSSSSWHCLDHLTSSNTSSPSCAMQNRGRLGQPAPPPGSSAAAGGSSQGGSMLRVVSGPEMPQPPPPQHQPSLASSGAFHQLSGAPGSCSQAHVLTVGGPGVMMGSALPRPQPSAVASCGPMEGQHPMMAKVVFDRTLPQGGLQGPHQGTQQHQPGRINAAGGYGCYSSLHQQRPFRGNRPFGPPKGRQHGPPVRGSSGQPPRPAGAGGVGRVVEGTLLASSSSPTPAHPGPHCPAPYCHITLEDGLKQLWSAEALARARGGRLYNVQQLAWHPVGEPDPCAQDMFNFQKLKRMVQKLDAVHKTRVKLIKRIHSVADHGDCDLKAVYREVRVLIGEMLHDSAMMIKSLDECRVTGLVRLALMLQEALTLGPKEADVAAQAAAQEAARAQNAAAVQAAAAAGAQATVLAVPGAW